MFKDESDAKAITDRIEPKVMLRKPMSCLRLSIADVW
jgi:hypothetical protein